MINSSIEAQERIEALIIYKYLILYNEFENCIKTVFFNEWDTMDPSTKNRIAYYVGWLGSETKYIEYDTYSIKQEIAKYDESVIIKKLTANQLIKIDKKEKSISSFTFEIMSKVKKQLTFLSHDCFLCFVNMRNKLAHNLADVNRKMRMLLNCYQIAY